MNVCIDLESSEEKTFVLDLELRKWCIEMAAKPVPGQSNKEAFGYIPNAWQEETDSIIDRAQKFYEWITSEHPQLVFEFLGKTH